MAMLVETCTSGNSEALDQVMRYFTAYSLEPVVEEDREPTPEEIEASLLAPPLPGMIELPRGLEG